MGTVRLLHLEDDASAAFFARKALEDAGLTVEVRHAATRGEFEECLSKDPLDAVLIDSGLPGLSSSEAIAMAHARNSRLPVIILSNSDNPQQVSASFAAGASDYVVKGHWWQLIAALRRLEHPTVHLGDDADLRSQRLSRLVTAVQELSLARNLDAIMAITRRAARELTGADGATFILRDGNQCYYADEDAIGPLWKGHRFPMERCVSGWVMTHRQPAVSEDVLTDARIPHEAYRPTFVKSLLVVPIRVDSPVGAIGNYWARRHAPTPDEIQFLQMLANMTAVAMESAGLYSELERRVRSRTMQLEAANKELEAFSYSVAHDLRGPLHAVGGYADLIAMKTEDSLDPETKSFFKEIHSAIDRMTGLIDDLLRLAKIGRLAISPENLDLSAIANAIFLRISARAPQRNVQLRVQPGLRAWADEGMIRIVIENLLSNAFKYTARKQVAVIDFGTLPDHDGQAVFFVRDNGAGFDPLLSEKLFAPFQRLHRQDEFEGTGVGLATVQRIIHRHGGRVWADGQTDKGATFYFSLPTQEHTARALASADKPIS